MTSESRGAFVLGSLCPYCGYETGRERAGRCPECGRELGRRAAALVRYRRWLAWRASRSMERTRATQGIVAVLALLLGLLTGAPQVLVMVLVLLGVTVGLGAVAGRLTARLAKPHERETARAIWRRNEGWLHVPWMLAPAGWLPLALIVQTHDPRIGGWLMLLICLLGVIWISLTWLGSMARHRRLAMVGTPASRLATAISGLLVLGGSVVFGLVVLALGLVIFGRRF